MLPLLPSAHATAGISGHRSPEVRAPTRPVSLLAATRLGVGNDAASVVAVYSIRVESARFRKYFGHELRASAQGYSARDQVLRRGARRKNSLGRLLLFDDSAKALAANFLAFRKFLPALVFGGDRRFSIELPVDAFRRALARAGKVNMPEDNKPESNPTTTAGPPAPPGRTPGRGPAARVPAAASPEGNHSPPNRPRGGIPESDSACSAASPQGTD
jgi:hypothetical protein